MFFMASSCSVLSISPFLFLSNIVNRSDITLRNVYGIRYEIQAEYRNGYTDSILGLHRPATTAEADDLSQ